jgi:hypothetical protein
MYVYLPRVDALLFAPSVEISEAYLAAAASLEELEARQRKLEQQRRSNIVRTH